jgi:hypothetical protein
MGRGMGRQHGQQMGQGRGMRMQRGQQMGMAGKGRGQGHMMQRGVVRVKVAV